MQSSTKDKAESELREREDELRQSGHAVLGGGDPGTEQPADLAGLMDRPDVKAAIAGAVAEAVARLVGELEAQRVAAGTGLNSGDRAFTEGLALAIHELVDQGKPGAKRSVAPAVLAQRKLARERMVAAILAARANALTPEYELKGEVYLEEQRVMPVYVDRYHVRRTTRIGWPGVPNQAMEPANPVAREIFGHFLDSIGSAALAVDDPLRGGLVVLGRETAVPEVPEMAPGSRPYGLEIRQVEPVGEAKEPPVHVLGSIAPPLRANPW